MRADLAIWGGFIYSADTKRSVYSPGAIIIRDGVIIDVGPEEEIRAKSYKCAQELKTTDKIVLPGFVNCHGHGPLILGRGFGDNLELQLWLDKITWPLMSQMDEEISYWGALLACYEMIVSGITTFADMWPFPKAVGKAAVDSGLRAIIATNIKDLNDIQRIDGELAKLNDLITWHKELNNNRINIAIGAHSPYACSQQLLSRLVHIATDKGLPIQIHVAETQKEITDSYKNFGKTPVEFLNSIDLFNVPTLAVHCVWLEENDIEILVKNKVSVAHNPISNAKLASGIAPVRKLLDANVNVGLATDSALSGNRLDMFETIKTSVLLQRVREYRASALIAEEAILMATIEGAKSLSLDQEIGSIEIGKRADIIVLRPEHLANVGSKENILSYITFTATASEVKMVLVDGQIVMHNKHILSIDKDVLYEQVRAITPKLISPLSCSDIQQQ